MLTERRFIYKPFLYPEAYDFFLSQNQAFWIHTEVSMARDIQDFKLKLSDDERLIIGNILKSFVQSEVLIADFWRRIPQWFPHPELALMANAFSNMEGIHMSAYSYLNDSLGLTDYAEFLTDEAAKARLDNLQIPGKELSSKLQALAIFSAFGEGVSLFSAFAILLSFSLRNRMKGVGEIVEFSIRDESLHSRAGCWLVRKVIQENPELWKDELKKQIYDAARLCVALEDQFIDSVFDGRSLENLSSTDLKQYIRHRANAKLQEIGLKSNWKNIDKEAIERLSWMNFISSGAKHADFFAGRVTDYSRGVGDTWDNIWAA